MDAVQGIAELVAEDHRLIDALFRQFEGAGGRAIAAQICEALDQQRRQRNDSWTPPCARA